MLVAARQADDEVSFDPEFARSVFGEFRFSESEDGSGLGNFRVVGHFCFGRFDLFEIVR